MQGLGKGGSRRRHLQPGPEGPSGRRDLHRKVGPAAPINRPRRLPQRGQQPRDLYGTRDKVSDPPGAVTTIASAFAPSPVNFARSSGFDSSRNSPPP